MGFNFFCNIKKITRAWANFFNVVKTLHKWTISRSMVEFSNDKSFSFLN